MKIVGSGKNCGLVVRFRALDMRSVGDGVFEAVVPAKPVNREQANVLDTLFPNTQNRIEAALQTEALIAACDSAEAPAPGGLSQE